MQPRWLKAESVSAREMLTPHRSPITTSFMRVISCSVGACVALKNGHMSRCCTYAILSLPNLPLNTLQSYWELQNDIHC